MQDIDFGKLRFSKKPGAKQDLLRHQQSNVLMTNLRKLLFIIFIFLFAFSVGLLSGIYLNNKKLEPKNGINQEPITNYLEKDKDIEKKSKTIENKTLPKDQDEEEKMVSWNIGPTNSGFPDRTSRMDRQTSEKVRREKKKTKIDEKKDTFLIWVKTYQNRNQAYQHGYFLKKEDLPAFLARSGDKMKLYVGPIKGANEAYRILAQVKRWEPFKGAILHRKK